MLFMVIERYKPALLDRWIAAWRDLVDFEVVQVQSSSAAAYSARTVRHRWDE